MSVPPHIAKFVDSFYAISDATDHERWVQCFTPDAEIDMAGQTAKGSEEIMGVRNAGWAATKNRKHYGVEVFVNADQPDIALVTGQIDLDVVANGAEVRGAQWVGRMTFEGDKLKGYKVWVVSPRGQGEEELGEEAKRATSCADGQMYPPKA